jgi:hypothetical protein
VDDSGRLSMFMCCKPFGVLREAESGVRIFLGRFCEEDVKEFAPATPGRRGGGAKTIPKTSLRAVLPLGLDISG